MEAYPIFKEEPTDELNESDDDDEKYVNTNVDPLCFLQEEETSESGDEDEPARKRSKSGRNSEAVKAQNKLRQARRRLRIKLSKSGASPEEIEMEVQKLEASYKASPPVPTSTQRPTHEEIKAKNRMRQAKRRLKIKLRESGASQENIEREIANLFERDGTTEEFVHNKFEVDVTATSVLPCSNIFITSEKENIQQNSEIPFFPTPPAEPLEDEEEVDIAELRTQHVYVGRVKLDNLANEPSSKDEYEEQNSSNRTDVDAYLQRKEKRRKRTEYMKTYRRRLREGLGTNGGMQVKQEPFQDVVKLESGHDESVPCVIRPVPVLNTFANQQQHRLQEQGEWRKNFMQHYRRKQREKAEKERMTLLEQKIKKDQEEGNRRQKIMLTRKTRQEQLQLMESSEDKLQKKRRRNTKYMRINRMKKRCQPEEEIVSFPNKKSQKESEPCSSSKPNSRASYMREWQKLKKQNVNSQSSSSSSIRIPIVVRVKKSSSCDEWERGGYSNKIIATPLQNEEIEKVKRLQVSIVRLTIHEINLGIRGKLKC